MCMNLGSVSYCSGFQTAMQPLINTGHGSPFILIADKKVSVGAKGSFLQHFTGVCFHSESAGCREKLITECYMVALRSENG